MHVAHVEAGALAAQAAGAECGERALVGQFGQGIGLIHELAELAGAEEFAHRRHDRPDVDQRDRRDALTLADGHALADDALGAAHPDAQLVLDQLADRLDTAVAQVVDVIRAGRAIVDLDHVAHQLDQVVGGDGSRGALNLVVQPQALVQLVAPDALQIVTALVKELADQVLAGVVQGRGIAGAHPLVELQQGCFGDGLAFPQVPLWLHLHCAGQVPVIGIVVGLGIERQKLFVRAGLDRRDLAVAVIHSGQGA